jgi:hypothetical protein
VGGILTHIIVYDDEIIPAMARPTRLRVWGGLGNMYIDDRFNTKHSRTAEALQGPNVLDPYPQNTPQNA